MAESTASAGAATDESARARDAAYAVADLPLLIRTPPVAHTAAWSADAAASAAASDFTATRAAEDAARVIFETATIDTPLTAQLRCIRRDFARLKRLAREEKWTDETPVPPEVFGPMWPPGVEPYWAVESPGQPTG